jgi:cold shock CspA family protein
LDIRSDGFKNLSEGQQVEFIPVESSKGLRATEVHVIDKEKKE